MENRPFRRYGHLGFRCDPRDRLQGPRASLDPLPSSADLRPLCAPVVDQGGLGSCTANALAGLVGMEIAIARGGNAPVLSRLAIYWGERFRAGTADFDSGAYLRDGLKVAASAGAPLEELWPYYDADPGPYLDRPDDGVWGDAHDYRIASYHRTDTLDMVRAELAGGHPVAFGFSVPVSFEDATTAATGVMRPPGQDEPYLGGHAVLAIGYDDTSRRVLVRNSWGSRWGLAGNFWFPYQCWDMLVSEAWAARA